MISCVLSAGRYYDAVVDMIGDDGDTCTVTFDGYSTTEVCKARYDFKTPNIPDRDPQYPIETPSLL